jgi:hypothetical protein
VRLPFRSVAIARDQKDALRRIRSGDPKMPLYKSWAVGIAEGLKDQFDEETIWIRTKSDYLFYKQVQQLGPVK